METSPEDTNNTASPEKILNTSITDDKDIKIGGIYLIKRSETQLQPALIIQIRSSAEISQEKEYYVHYVGLNRRLDEWISQDKITDPTEAEEEKNENSNPGEKSSKGNSAKTLKELSKDQIASLDNTSAENSDRKLTRNQKRRHDEINHVQKTYAEMDPTTAALGKFVFVKEKVLSILVYSIDFSREGA